MISISSRFLKQLPKAVVGDAVDRELGDGYPLHEVDAHVLVAIVYPREAGINSPFPAVAQISRKTVSSSQDSRAWLVLFQDEMCGNSPLAAALLQVQVSNVRSESHCIVTISDFTTLRRPPSLPYDLRRVGLTQMCNAVWTIIEPLQLSSVDVGPPFELKRAS